MNKIALCLLAVVTATGYAGDVYVNAANYGKSGLSGKTEGLAYGTIQDAVEAAEEGDVIHVLPGVYDQGGAALDSHQNRVAINGKGLTIRSTGGRAVTTIVGALDADDPTGSGTGVGPRAVRAIRVTNSSEHPVVIEGFTITGSSCHANEKSLQGYGGAVCADNRDAVCLVDCDIFGNTGVRGLVYRAICVRCHIHDNRLPGGKGSACWQGALVNCAIARNVGGTAICAATAVNCTLDGHDGAIAGEGACVLSSILCGCASFIESGDSIVCSNSISDLTLGAGDIDGVTSDVMGVSRYQCVAPVLGDFAPVVASDARDVGRAEDLALVSLPAGVDAYVDYAGNPILQTGKIFAGCCQAAKEVKTGVVSVSGSFSFVGSEAAVTGGGYFHSAEESMAQWHIRPQMPSGTYLFGFDIDGALGTRRYPEMDDTFWLMSPPVGQVAMVTILTTKNACWVDPEKGRDEPVADEIRGTESDPFKTLQAAVDACPGDENRSVVFAAAGTYDQGGRTEGSCGNRVVCSKHVRIKGAGAGVSIIKGELDTSSEDHTADGRGTLAKRCAFLEYGAIQGFTLTEGRSAWAGGSTSKQSSTSGGAAYLQNGGMILDCRVENCIAYRGSAFFGRNATSYGHIFRSEIVDCPGGSSTVNFYSCLIRVGEADTASPVGSAATTYRCTVIGTSSVSGQLTDDSFAYGSVIVGGTTVKAATPGLWHDCVVWGFSKYNATEGLRIADPCFVSVGSGDWRVLSCSPAIGAAGSAESVWSTYSSDFASNPLCLVDGTVMAGAFQRPVAAVVVSPSAQCGVTPAGTNVVEDGHSLVIIAQDGNRPALDLTVDGAGVGAASWTYVAPADALVSAPVFVQAVYQTNLYVNADASIGDDAKDGFSPMSPKRTLKGAMAISMPGDTVHAAAGNYNSDCVEVAAGEQVHARLRIDRNDICVVADDGPEVTFISGSASDGSEGYVRCVYADDVTGSVVRGFTLTGGRTLTSEVSDVEHSGAAAFCQNTSMRFENCIVSDNIARIAGASWGGTFVNCRFTGNCGVKNRAVSSGSDMYGCYLDYNVGSTAQGTVYNASAVVNCTFGSHNTTSPDGSGEVIAAIGSPLDGCEVKNNVILCANFARLNGVAVSVLNCAFKNLPTDAGVTTDATSFEVDESCLDAAGVPVKGSALIDKGTNSVLADHAGFLSEDLGCGQRVMNGTIDIGCREYDWRPDYAAAIGGGVCVADVASDVTLAGGVLRIPPSATIAGTWPSPSAGRKVRYSGAVSSEGGRMSGTFLASGSVLKDVSVTDGTMPFDFRSTESELTWSFAFVGDDGFGSLTGFQALAPGGCVLIVR